MARIREFQTSDLRSVIELFRSNIPKYFMPAEEPGLRDFLRDHPNGYFVVEQRGEIVASGGIALNSDGTACLCWGMVRNDLIGTGLGKELTQFRIESSRDKFGDVPFVISTSQHTEGFYKRFGFVTIEHIPNGFGPGLDICKMRRLPDAS